MGTAIPVITSEFESLPDVAWYGSAYLFTMCSFQLFFGKLYAEFNAKWVFLAALFIFEVGSIVCAVAPSSVVLIVGRAISGVGAAGLMSGALIVSLSCKARRLPVSTELCWLSQSRLRSWLEVCLFTDARSSPRQLARRAEFRSA